MRWAQRVSVRARLPPVAAAGPGIGNGVARRAVCRYTSRADGAISGDGSPVDGVERCPGAPGGGDVDFIVLGAILGAITMAAGTVLRDLVPRRLRVDDDDTPWVTVRDRRRVVRVAVVGGRLLTIAGITILAATVALVLLDAADRVALGLVVGLTVLAIIACAGWVVWYRYQESTGAIQRRQLQAIAGRLGRASQQTSDGQSTGARGANRAGINGRQPGPTRPVMASSAQAATSRRVAGRERPPSGAADPAAAVPSRSAGGSAPAGRSGSRRDGGSPASPRTAMASTTTDPGPARAERGSTRDASGAAARRATISGGRRADRSRDSDREQRG